MKNALAYYNAGAVVLNSKVVGFVPGSVGRPAKSVLIFAVCVNYSLLESLLKFEEKMSTKHTYVHKSPYPSCTNYICSEFPPL
jgi:hypothetical protein